MSKTFTIGGNEDSLQRQKISMVHMEVNSALASTTTYMPVLVPMVVKPII